MVTQLLMAGLLAVAGASPAGVGGVVVDGDDKPVAGALVVLVRSVTGEEADQEQSTRSDDRGRFVFDRWRHDGASWHVLAYKAGLALGGAAVQEPGARSRFGEVDRPPHDMKLRLLQPSSVRVRLERPGGQAPGVQVLASLVQFGLTRERGTDGARALVFRAPVPEVLSEQLGLLPKRDGALVLECLPTHSNIALKIKCPGLGTQQVRYLNPKPGVELIVRLQPVGSLSGRVVADDPKAVAGVKVRISTTSVPPQSRRSADPNAAIPAEGYAHAITDETGRFEVKELAAGAANLSIGVRNEQGWLPPAAVAATVEAGKTAELKVLLTRGIRVHGRVVAEGLGEGIAGVEIYLGEERVASDAKGEFQAYTRAGRIPVHVLRVPLPWLPPIMTYRGTEVPAGQDVHELAPIKLKRGLPVEGVVVDEDSRPVLGARVTAVWRKTDGQLSTLGSDSTLSEADGRFVLPHVEGDVELSLTALTNDRATTDFVKVPPRQRQPLRLRVRPEAAVVFVGRVLNQEGQAVPGALVQFRKALRLPAGHIYGQSLVPFGEDPLKTDAEGWYRTPLSLARNEQYSLTIETPGMVKHESGYVTPAKEGESFRWPDVILRRDRLAVGTVVEVDGKPVRGATVWSHGLRQGLRVTGQTDSAGKFRLAQLHPDARLVFVHKEGYRPSGECIPRSGELRLTLESQGTPPAALLRSVQWPRADRQQLLKDLVTPLLPRLKEAGGDYFVVEALKRLAPHDRAFVLSQLDRLRSDDSRAEVLVALGQVDDAQEFAALVKDPYRRAYEYLMIADAAVEPAQKRRILAEALVDARTVEQPDRRFVLLCGIADRLFKLNDRAAAQKVLDEGKRVAGQLPPTQWNGHARGRFAEVLALVDVAAALNLIKDLKEQDDITRHAGDIAYRLADVQPAEAERALGLIKYDRYVTPAAVRVCYRMAGVDLPRARRIADRLATDDRVRGATQKAHALGLMAMALAEKDASTARELLRQGFDQLASLGGRRDWYSARSAFPVAGLLLGYSETVNPEQTRAYFWRTLALHPGPSAESWSPNERVQQAHENTAQLVLLLALYGQFPELQSELLESVFQYWSGYTNRKEYNFYRQSSVFMAMALSAPRRAIAWHTDFFPKVDKEDRRRIPQPWMWMADAFGHQGVELHKRITTEVYHLWVIGEDDF